MPGTLQYGYQAGDACRRPDASRVRACGGIIEERPVENCSCHISPPCSACTAPREYCPECGWDARDDRIENDHRVNVDPKTGVYRCWEPRPLDPSKIDYHTKSHTHFSSIREGVYPPGTTRQEVEEKVKGTFGGRFEHFGSGTFKYVAYTD